MLTTRLFVAAAALGFGTAAFAQDFFDFDQIPGLPDNPTVQVDLNPPMLGIMAATARSQDPGIADLLAGIRGVRVRVYNSISDSAGVADYIERATQRLELSDWQPVVRVNDEQDVRVYMRGTEDTITGLTAMIFGDKEAVFVTIDGTISGPQLAAIASKFGNGEMLASLADFNIPQAPTQ
jgi:Domain of unknown function (DUF4252)